MGAESWFGWDFCLADVLGGRGAGLLQVGLNSTVGYGVLLRGKEDCSSNPPLLLTRMLDVGGVVLRGVVVTPLDFREELLRGN